MFFRTLFNEIKVLYLVNFYHSQRTVDTRKTWSKKRAQYSTSEIANFWLWTSTSCQISSSTRSGTLIKCAINGMHLKCPESTYPAPSPWGNFLSLTWSLVSESLQTAILHNSKLEGRISSREKLQRIYREEMLLLCQMYTLDLKKKRQT